MSVNVTFDVVETQLWPQRDARDPLGVWAARAGATGDATGGFVRGQLQVPAERRSSHIYTILFANTVRVTGTADTADEISCRLLTNWPNADNTVLGVQGASTYRAVGVSQQGNFTVPNAGPRDFLIAPQERFILLFDPGVVSSGSDMVLAEIQRNANVDATEYAFEAYGYYWDREVLSTPGGPRHPGSS